MRSKRYRDDNLTLARLLEIVSVYHHKDALILVPEEKVNRAVHNSGKGTKRFNNRCWRCDKPGHIARDCQISKNHTCGTCGKQRHMEFFCHTKVEKHGKGGRKNRNKSQSGNKPRPGVRNISDKPSQHKEEGGDEVKDDSYYVFSASDGESHTLTVIDSGATCNLMSQNVFNKVSKGKIELSKTDRKIHAYA